MRVVLWDTQCRGVSKDFAGGMGVGVYHGAGGLRGRLIRRFYTRDRRPVTLSYAYLAAIFRQFGHRVTYRLDRSPGRADLYVFHPALVSLDVELQVIRRLRQKNPSVPVLVVGPLVHALPERFAELDVTLVRGEPEQLRWKLDEVLQHGPGVVDVGSVADLDALPFPDWSVFDYRRFRVGYDFSRFPTAFVQQSRGCSFRCNYCPYILVENRTRFRSPESVVEEIRRDLRDYGFRSFKFRDPLFGLDRQRVLRLAELLRRLPEPVQFSVESHINLLPEPVLEELSRAGLTSVTVGIERPEADVLRRYKRSPIRDDRQRRFIETCRRLGVRTVAGFLIGFPDDTEASIRAVLRYARQLNPTFANFNVVTPYPGTEFFEQVRHRVADFDFARYDVYTPVLRYEYLTAEQVRRLHEKCFNRYYFRWEWLRENAPLLWPRLARLLEWFQPKVQPSHRPAVEVGAEPSPAARGDERRDVLPTRRAA